MTNHFGDPFKDENIDFLRIMNLKPRSMITRTKLWAKEAKLQNTLKHRRKCRWVQEYVTKNDKCWRSTLAIKKTMNRRFIKNMREFPTLLFSWRCYDEDKSNHHVFRLLEITRKVVLKFLWNLHEELSVAESWLSS